MATPVTIKGAVDLVLLEENDLHLKRSRQAMTVLACLVKNTNHCVNDFYTVIVVSGALATKHLEPYVLRRIGLPCSVGYISPNGKILFKDIPQEPFRPTCHYLTPDVHMNCMWSGSN